MARPASRKRHMHVAPYRNKAGTIAPHGQTAAALTPGIAATLEALTDPARRPAHPLLPKRSSLRRTRLEALRTSKRGSAADLSGAPVELYKLFLDDAEALGSCTFAVNVAASTQPSSTGSVKAIALTRLTALRKANGGVRGIATGDVFRRLVSRALARAFSEELEAASRPFRFTLQSRAGTDSLAAMLRGVVSLDGRSAYNTISCATILAKLLEAAPSLLPLYARTSIYLWWDDEGRVHEIVQAEGVAGILRAWPRRLAGRR